MYKKKFVIKDLTRLVYWTASQKDEDEKMFNPRVLNAKKFDTVKAAEKEIKTYSVTTGGCKMSHTVLEIIAVYFTNQK